MPASLRYRGKQEAFLAMGAAFENGTVPAGWLHANWSRIEQRIMGKAPA